MKLHGLWQGEGGFSILEVVITIIVMTIILLIASSTWFDTVERRRVDSATSQVVGELHRAHNSATNRLEDWRVVMDAGADTYRIGPDGGALSAQLLPERTAFHPATGVSAIVFEPDGEAQLTGAGNISVADDDGSPCHEIEVNTVTSRIEVFRYAC